jgi:serine/threonine protein kinase
LRHGGPIWGHVLFGLMLRRRESDGIYEEPSSSNEDTTDTTSSSSSSQRQQVTKVAIKRIKLQILQTELANGCREDPYREIYRLQTIGDNQHVLPIVEALQDEKYLYIITPWCEEGSLLDYMLKKPLCTRYQSTFAEGEDRARKYFIQMMEDIQYIHEKHGICHRDIKPG